MSNSQQPICRICSRRHNPRASCPESVRRPQDDGDGVVTSAAVASSNDDDCRNSGSDRSDNNSGGNVGGE